MWVDDSEQEPLTSGTGSFWRQRKGLILLICFVAWNLLLFLLAVIALSKESKVENNQYNTVSYQLEAELTFAGDDPPSEFAVSIQSDGTLTLGGGSTIYQNVVQMKELMEGNSTTMSSLTALRLGETRFLLGFQVVGGTKAGCYLVVGTVKASKDEKKINFGDSVSVGICPLSLIALTDELFVGVRYGNFFTFTISDKDNIKPGSNASFSTIGVDSLIAPLTENTFAITYYDNTASNLTTSVAIVGANNTISLLSTLSFSPDRNTHELVAFSNSSYMSCYPTNVYPEITGNLGCSLFSFNGTDIALVSQGSYSASTTSVSFGLTALSSTQAAIVWVDQGLQSNDRLMAAVIEIQQGTNIVFGSSMILNSGDASGVLTTGLYPEIVVLSTSSSQFSVLYSDFANQGRITLTTVNVNDEDILSTPSSSFSTVALASPANTDDSGYYWLAMTAQTPTQFVIFDCLSFPTSYSGGIHVGEVLNRAIGITTSKKVNKVVDVTVGGIATLDKTKLVPGMTYFATTQGVLVKGPEYGSSKVTAQGFLQSGDLLISANSCLGIALDQQSLLLHACY